jgi:hypothetical protein
LAITAVRVQVPLRVRKKSQSSGKGMVAIFILYDK